MRPGHKIYRNGLHALRIRATELSNPGPPKMLSVYAKAQIAMPLHRKCDAYPQNAMFPFPFTQEGFREGRRRPVPMADTRIETVNKIYRPSFSLGEISSRRVSGRKLSEDWPTAELASDEYIQLRGYEGSIRHADCVAEGASHEGHNAIERREQDRDDEEAENSQDTDNHLQESAPASRATYHGLVVRDDGLMQPHQNFGSADDRARVQRNLGKRYDGDESAHKSAERHWITSRLEDV